MKYRMWFLLVTVLALVPMIFFMLMVTRVPLHITININKLDLTISWRSKNVLLKETKTKVNISNNIIQSGFKHCNKTFLSRHHMTMTYPSGRLGNNVFQLLTLLGTAIEHCYTPVITDQFFISNTLHEVFDLTHFERIRKVPRHWRKYRQPSANVYSPDIKRLDHSSNWSLTGYFQSWKYFDSQKPLIKSLLKFRKSVSDSALAFINTMTQFRKKSKVCIHHRRGDFLRADHQRTGFSAAGIGFLNNAMQYFMNKLKDTEVAFIFLSDDIEWCKKNITGNNVYFSPFSSNISDITAGKDLALMSYCDHCIVTSGTFGWIGAWLGNGHVVYYKGYPTPGSPMDRRMNRKDYYPSHWIGMM